MSFECRFQGCTNVYRGPAQREYHERRHQSVQDNRSFSCNFDDCSYRAYQYSNLKAHANAVHCQEPSGVSRPVESVNLGIHPSESNGVKRRAAMATTESLSALVPILDLPTVSCKPIFDPTIHSAPSSSTTLQNPDFHGHNAVPMDIRHKVPNSSNSLEDEQRQGHGAAVPSTALHLDQDRREAFQVQSAVRPQRFDDIARGLPCPWEHFNPGKRVERSSDYIPLPDPRRLFG